MEDRKLSDSQIKGIDLSVRAIKKVYPFLMGWKLSEGWEKYETNTYIDIYINSVELGKLFDMEVTPYFKQRIIDGEKISSAAILAPFNWGYYGTDEFNEIGEMSSKLNRNINDSLKKSYGYIPDEMKIYWSTTYGGKYVSNPKIDYFIFEF